MCGKGHVLATFGHLLTTLGYVILGQSQNDHHGVDAAGKPVVTSFITTSIGNCTSLYLTIMRHMCTQGLVAGSHATVRQTQIQDFYIYSSTQIYDSFDTDMDLPSEMKRALSRAEIELLQFHLQHLQQAMKSSKLELPQSKKENQSQKDVCKTAGCKGKKKIKIKI